MIDDAQIGYWDSEPRLFIQQPAVERQKGIKEIVNRTRYITSIEVLKHLMVINAVCLHHGQFLTQDN